MIAAALMGRRWLWWRGRLFDHDRYLRRSSYGWPLGFIAIISGWIVTEVGSPAVGRARDPAHRRCGSPVTAGAVFTSLLLFVLVYFVVFSIGIVLIRRMLRKGPVRETRRAATARRVAESPDRGGGKGEGAS